MKCLLIINVEVEREKGHKSTTMSPSYNGSYQTWVRSLVSKYKTLLHSFVFTNGNNTVKLIHITCQVLKLKTETALRNILTALN